MLVPKGPSVSQPFDRAKAHALLFSLPLPPRGIRGRPYPYDTPLGRIMWLKGLTVRQVSGFGGTCPHHRTLCEYLAGRVELLPHHRAALGRALGVDPRIL